jgi:hypothetical protein
LQQVLPLHDNAGESSFWCTKRIPRCNAFELKKVKRCQENGPEICTAYSLKAVQQAYDYTQWIQPRQACNVRWDTMMKADFKESYDLQLPYDIRFILFFKFCYFMMIVTVITIHWYNFFILRSLKIFLNARTGYIQHKFV